MGVRFEEGDEGGSAFSNQMPSQIMIAATERVTAARAALARWTEESQ